MQVIADCYLAGVSTRRVDKLVKQLRLDGITKSQVSELAKSVDETVEGWRNRPLDGSPYTYIWVDALTQNVREGGRIVHVAVVHAVGVYAEGKREALGMDVITTEAGWTAFLRSLVARGLSGVQLVISDAHGGLKDAVAAVLPGAVWQRCRSTPCETCCRGWITGRRSSREGHARRRTGECLLHGLPGLAWKPDRLSAGSAMRAARRGGVAASSLPG